MLWLSIAVVFAATLVSSFSKSGLRWAGLMLAAMTSGYLVGSAGLHGYLFVVDAVLLMAMFTSRQGINLWWQDAVYALQVMICGLYVMYAALAGAYPWLVSVLIDSANVMFVAQAAIVALGGGRNSYNNIQYVRSQRKRGVNMNYLPTVWRMT